MTSCYGGASVAISARIGGAWNKSVVGKQDLSLKQWGNIYQCCVRPVLLYCCETWKLTAADEVRLRGVERRMIRIMCRVRLVDRVSSDILCDRMTLGGCCCEDSGYDNSTPFAV